MSDHPRTCNANGTPARGSSNGNDRGNTETRRRRRAWLLETYAADVSLIKVTYVGGGTEVVVAPHLEWWLKFIDTDVLMIRLHDSPALPVADAVEVPTARCFHCGCLLHDGTITVDRIKPGAHGGTYARNNIRPACAKHNSSLGGGVRRKRRTGPGRGSSVTSAAETPSD